MLHYTTDEVPATYVESTEDSWSVLSFECSLDLSICLLAVEYLAGAMLHYTTDELKCLQKVGKKKRWLQVCSRTRRKRSEGSSGIASVGRQHFDFLGSLLKSEWQK